MGYYHWGEDYFTHEFPPAYKGATACRGIDFNDNAGENLQAVGPDSPLIGVYSLDVFAERVSKIIQGHAVMLKNVSAAHSTNTDSDNESSHTTNALPSVAPPLFLYIAWQNCHDPYDVPQKYPFHPQ